MIESEDQPRENKADLAASMKSAVGDLSRALELLRETFERDPASLRKIAYAFNAADCFREGLSFAKYGLRIDPNDAQLHHLAARALSITGNVEACRFHSEQAARLMPSSPLLQYHYANTLLRLGDYEEGWKRHRWYYAMPGKEKELVFPPFREWRGEPVAGTSFLLVGEQGRGDEIQFLRFAHWLERHGATVDVLVSAEVAPLAASVTAVRHVYISIPPGPYTYWCHMFKVPECMRLDLAMLPVATHYLRAPLVKVNDWRRRIQSFSTKGAHARSRRIGFVWSGSPQHGLDRFRSISIETLRPLFSLQGSVWFSLQKGREENGADKIARRAEVYSLGSLIHDFSDTLAAMYSMDLIITVDTSVAHLAGAAGIPVWVMIPACSDWRWLSRRTDSPWYPTMRLFRQRELGNWHCVIDEVRDALVKWR